MSEPIPPLTFDEFQCKAAVTAIYPRDAALLYPALGYAGEAGELIEKVMKGVFPGGPPTEWDDRSCWMRALYYTLSNVVKAAKDCEVTKKVIRDQTAHLPAGVLEDIRERVAQFPEADKPGMLKELGDCAWYCAGLCSDAGVTMDQIARDNLAKLAARKAKGTLSGSGDLR